MRRAIIVFFVFTSAIAIAQPTDKVGQLVSAENYFAALTQEKGIRKAFLEVSDNNTVVFRPGPVSAAKYFKNKSDSLGLLSWEPVFARISKSGDWGVTSGPSTYRQSDTSSIHYGDYLSVWKKNPKGVWKLALDLGIDHPKPKAKQSLLFQNPKNEIYQKQRSDERLQQREDVVISSDRLMATILKADDQIAFKDFISDECRLLFPGQEPIIGKKAIMSFWQKQGANLSSEPLKADRSYSGELAYTHGNANIIRKGIKKEYHYVRIWELQPGYLWNVIFEIYVPAEKEE
ncbi:MAG: DUF4440 domain-containing protein [Sphingobacteriaceae bacterium]|nr:DUF4440 domain-containing protein [Sphingobacteriaceae bacterium]